MRIFLLLIVSLLISSQPFADEKTGGQTLESEQEATELAFATLKQEIGADEKDIVLIRLTRFSWPNSALGCPQPGMSYTDAIVPGYVALLKYDQAAYRVHIGNGRGLICKLKRMPMDLGGLRLDYLKKMAVADLADKLGVDPEKITVVEDQAMVWPDTNFGCSAGPEPAVARTIRGYGIKLEYRDKIYEYRAGQAKVMPCPPILTE